ncbi:MAG TPA: hypothetical protein VIV07_07715 [Sphingomicrobium sp.]
MAEQIRSSMVREIRVSADEKSRPARGEHNNPVPLEAFDRERMGIAAKE